MGLLFVELFSIYVQPVHFPHWEFMPLLMTSVYCSIGMLYSWGLFWQAYWQDLGKATL
jgi:hypothetical protein